MFFMLCFFKEKGFDSAIVTYEGGGPNYAIYSPVTLILGQNALMFQACLT